MTRLLSLLARSATRAAEESIKQCWTNSAQSRFKPSPSANFWYLELVQVALHWVHDAFPKALNGVNKMNLLH